MRRLIFWDFPRASWPYDLVVGLIVIFIFATPRRFFHDQPIAPAVILLGSDQVFIADKLLESVPASERVAVATKVIHQRIGKNWHVSRVEPMRDDSAHEVEGFIAYTTQPN